MEYENGQAALDGFSQAAIEGFTQATIDYFGQTTLDGFSNAALEGFIQASLDGFTSAAMDGFSMVMTDGFTLASMDGFTLAVTDAITQASLDGFTQSAIDAFALAVMDAFTTAAIDTFTQAALSGFTLAVADGFTLTSMDGFSLAAIDEFEAAILEGFGQAGLDQFTQADINWFMQVDLEVFTLTALDGFTLTSLEGFESAALEGFTAAGLDLVLQSILAQFDAAYFEQLLLDTLDSIYGAKARQQPALVNVNAAAAHQYSTGAGTLVAVIDTGITDNWYLRGKIAPNGYDYVDGDNDPTDVANGLDDNGNGLVDEGWGHGTHVSGIVSLVAPDAQILPIRVQDSDGGGWSFIVAEGIQYAVDHGADVINVSLGFPCKSQVVEWAVDYAFHHRVPVIGSVGNYDVDTVDYPAGVTRAIAVAAVDDNDVKTVFSNYSSRVDIAMPGSAIYSAYGNGMFAWWSGTSQATPMVAGEAALLLQSDATLTPDEIRNLIKQSGKDVTAKNAGKELTMGGGLADTFAALKLIGGYLVADTSVFTSADSIDSPDLLTNTAEETDEIGEAWWDTNWQARTKITFDQWAPGENLVDFPVLVSLSSASVDFAKIMSGGADMRFIDDDGVTALPYEIEDWDDVAETANVWVKVPQIDAGSTSDHIWMYYNNASAADNQNSAGVWTNGYSAVWHLDETSGNTISDSTSNGNDGTKRSVTEPSPVTNGMIGGAQHFDGLDDFVTNNTLVSTQSLTMEAWVSPDALPGGWNTVIEVGDDQPWFGILGSSKIAIYRGSAGIESIAKVTLSTFNHIVVTHDGSTVRMWINGVEDTPPGSLTNSNTATGFGVGYNGSDGVFDGIIDEARISDTVRSDDWVVAQYRSMSLTFNTFGNEEVVIESSLIADTTGVVGPTVDTITTTDEIAAAAEAAAADATAAVIEATDEAATAEADADAKAAAAAESEVKAATAQAESEAKAAALAEAEAASAKADAEAAALADTEAATVATKAEAEAAISAKAEARAAKKAAKAEAKAAEKAAEAEAIAAEKAAKAEIIAETVTARSEARHESKRANGNRRGKK
ncbi:MAG: DUF2341 domain-containing protein [Chloroflexi bacterium]|nr:DUF2341 domain-containing protein [Chloroflexota bacterium]